jgi:YHS domain-containing protein
MMTRQTLWLGGAVLAGCLTLAGCNHEPAGTGPAADPPAAHDHADEGPHGGPLVEWGQEEYHLEFTVDPVNQEATIYVLDGNLKGPKPIPAEPLALTLQRPVVTIPLQPRPQAGDPAGSASRFVGTHMALAREGAFAGSISGTVHGKPYAGDFATKAHAGHEEQTHGDAPTAREVALFLTPGGLYTAADIERNGGVVPSVKFKGLSWAHDDDLKPGDKVCPVTANKADPQCTWVVNGQTYEFCCPPCLEKFVGWAKTRPEKVKPPDEYVK